MVDKKLVEEEFIMLLKSAEIQAVGNKMIKEVQKENRLYGIPLVYSVDGKIYYELADGTVTTKKPDILNDDKKSHKHGTKSE